jgi:hypothetical protein
VTWVLFWGLSDLQKHPLNEKHNLFLPRSFDNQKCLLPMSNVPCMAKWPLVEKHWCNVPWGPCQPSILRRFLWLSSSDSYPGALNGGLLSPVLPTAFHCSSLTWGKFPWTLKLPSAHVRCAF